MKNILNIFTYHRIQPAPRPDAVSVDMLRRQLRYLRRHYHVLTCGELIAYLDGIFESKRPCAAVTFDDGWYDNHLYATPVLRECGIQGIVALSSGFIRPPTVRLQPEHDAALPLNEACRMALYESDRSAFLSEKDIREMSGSGVWCFQAHGAAHVRHFKSLRPHRKTNPAPDDFSLPYALEKRAFTRNRPVGQLVSSLAWPRTYVPDEALAGDPRQTCLLLPQEDREAYTARVRRDLETNILDIQRLTNKRPALLFWPWGEYSSEALQVARELGFKFTFTVEKAGIPPGTRDFVLPRIGASERWTKFRRNSIVFRHPSMTSIRRLISPSPSGEQLIGW